MRRAMEKAQEAYVTFLKDFGYPNALNAKKEDFKRIFEGENRLFLLHWLLQEVGFAFVYPHNAQQKVMDLFTVELGNKFENSGFCLKSEKLDFVTGNLPFPKQKPIFDRTFHMLRMLKDKGNVNANQSQELTVAQNLVKSFDLSEFKDWLTKSRNLFDKMGPMIKYSESERKNRLSANKETIKAMEQELEELKHSDNFIEDFGLSEDVDVAFTECMEDLQKLLGKMTEKIAVAAKCESTQRNANIPADSSVCDALERAINEVNLRMSELLKVTVNWQKCREDFRKMIEKTPKAELANERSKILQQLNGCVEVLEEMDSD